MAAWNSSGYDLSIGTRWLYALLNEREGRVKIGLVLTENRLARRRLEVSRRHGEVVQAAASPIPDVTHQEAEHIESVVRRWLCGSSGFRHSGLVDWLDLPSDPPGDWQGLLDRAVQAALVFGRSSNGG